MLSISKPLSIGKASTYYKKDNYYTRSEGVWQGKGAEALGLEGEIKHEDFMNIVNGNDPKGDRVVPPNSKGERRAGIDLCFSASKSVSILSIFDDRIEKTHERAVSKTLDYIEKNYSQARRKIDGKLRKIDTGNLLIGRFMHKISRELDPQLHTHGFIANMTLDGDKWRAISNDKLFGRSKEGVKLFLGQIYRNELARNIKDLGYQIRADEKGLFEIKGVDQKLIDEFSQRSRQIDKQIPVLKREYPGLPEQKLREMACLESRRPKKRVDMNVIRENWIKRIKELGYSKEGILDGINREAERPRETERDIQGGNKADDYVKIAVRSLTENESTFKRSEVSRNALKLSVGILGIDQVENAIKNQNMGENIISLDKENGVYTTKEMQKIEVDIVKRVIAGYNAGMGILEKDKADQIINEKYSRLTKGQRDAVGHILTSNDKFIAIQGDAGTGKTTALKAVKKELDKLKISVIGLAYTGIARAEILNNSGIESKTLHSFLSDTKKTPGLSSNDKRVWIVDESSMTGSRRMLELIKRSEKENAKVVFMGDIKQLQAVEAGRLFAKLQEFNAIKTVEMREILRQENREYKEMVKDISEKKIDRAFDRLEGGKKIKTNEDRLHLLSEIVKDYTEGDHKDTIIVTGLNRDRKELNSIIREELKGKNKLGREDYSFITKESKSLRDIDKRFAQSYKVGETIVVNERGSGVRKGTEGRIVKVDNDYHRITIKTKMGQLQEIDLVRHGDKLKSYTENKTSFSKNDKIIFLENSKTLNVQNGLTGFVKSVNVNGDIAITIQGQNRDVTFNMNDYNNIDHGYAVTDYKSQGKTTKNVFVHAPTQERKQTFNSIYVSVTRGKKDITIYTDNAKELREQVKNEQVKSSTLDYLEESKEQNAKTEKLQNGDTQKGKREKDRFDNFQKAKKEYPDFQNSYLGFSNTKKHKSIFDTLIFADVNKSKFDKSKNFKELEKEM